MTGDDLQLRGWDEAEGSEWLAVDATTFRPSRIVAYFSQGEELSVSVRAVGEPADVRIVGMDVQLRPELRALSRAVPAADERAALQRSGWAMSRIDQAVLTENTLRRLDVAAMARTLIRVTLITVEHQGGKLIGVTDRDVRTIPPGVLQELVGRPGWEPGRPGPKPRATPEEVAAVWGQAEQGGGYKAVMSEYKVSVRTAHRYVMAAREAGLIEPATKQEEEKS